MKRITLMFVTGMLMLAVAAPAADANSTIRPAKAHIAKKCKKKAKHRGKCKRRAPAPVVPVAPPAPPAPLAITETEARTAVNQVAYNECLPDPYCYNYGIYVDGAGNISCDSKSTYTWTCFGWNDEYDGTFFTCDFRAYVERSGYSSVTYRRDSTYNGTGWNCY